MAQSFGITPTMIDSGRITAKIDKVGGIILNTLKHDKKNQQYNQVIQKGDSVLNSIQKLARTMDM